jgi:apolipoprotein D and lipocalin family protein
MNLEIQEDKRRCVKTVDSVDLVRHCGLWYEIERLPNSFQSACQGDVTAQYTLLEDGDIRVVNRCRTDGGAMKESAGTARPAEKNGPASKLKVRFAPAFLSFLPFVWGEHWVIELAKDFAYAVVGDPGRKYLWVLARSRTMDEETFQGILGRAAAQGYDVSRPVRTSQGR